MCFHHAPIRVAVAVGVLDRFEAVSSRREESGSGGAAKFLVLNLPSGVGELTFSAKL